MSYERNGPRPVNLRPLGYDCRLSGLKADAWRKSVALSWRPEIVAASYDTNVAMPMFVGPDEAPEEFQLEMDPKLISDPFFSTFQLFREAQEAISFVPDRAMMQDFQLLYYSLVLPLRPPTGILAGILNAMEGEKITPPKYQEDRLGYEVLDGDGTSVTHTYLELDELCKFDPVYLGEAADKAAEQGFWIVAIDQISHPYWAPQS